MTYEANREPVPKIGSVTVGDAWRELEEVFERQDSVAMQTVYVGEPGKKAVALLGGIARGQDCAYDVVITSAHTEAGLHTPEVTSLTCSWERQGGDGSSRVKVKMENGTIVGEAQPGVPKRLAAMLGAVIFYVDTSEAAVERLYPGTGMHLPDDDLTIAPMLELFPETSDMVAAQIRQIHFERYYETRLDQALPPS